MYSHSQILQLTSSSVLGNLTWPGKARQSPSHQIVFSPKSHFVLACSLPKSTQMPNNIKLKTMNRDILWYEDKILWKKISTTGSCMCSSNLATEASVAEWVDLYGVGDCTTTSASLFNGTLFPPELFPTKTLFLPRHPDTFPQDTKTLFTRTHQDTFSTGLLLSSTFETVEVGLKALKILEKHKISFSLPFWVPGSPFNSQTKTVSKVL